MHVAAVFPCIALFAKMSCTSFTSGDNNESQAAAVDNNSQLQPSWDDFTVEYEKRVEPFTSKFAEEMIRPFIVDGDGDNDVATTDITTSTKRRKLLDVGCGTGGGVSLPALSHGFHVTATDVSSAMVERCQQRAMEGGYVVIDDTCTGNTQDTDAVTTDSATFSCATTDGQSLPTEWSNSFDIALANFSVIFFPYPVAGLKEMYRCLVPSGVAAFTAWGSIDQTPAFRIFPDAAKELVPDLVSTGKPTRITGSILTLTNLMKEAGYVDIKVVGPVVKTLEVASPAEYYNRFALTSPPTAAMINKMDDGTKQKFRSRVMATAKARGGREDGGIALDSTAYIAYGRKPS